MEKKKKIKMKITENATVKKQIVLVRDLACTHVSLRCGTWWDEADSVATRSANQMDRPAELLRTRCCSESSKALSIARRRDKSLRAGF